MRKFLVLLAALLLLGQGQVLYAAREVDHPIKTQASPGTEPPKDPLEEKPIPEDEIRNQDFLVPSGQGVLKGNLKEKKEIENLKAQPRTSLCTSYLVGDLESEEILTSYQTDQVIGLASTSKLVSLYVIYDALAAGEMKLTDPVVMDEEVTKIPGSSLKSKPGERFSVSDLIDATLIISGNDAVTALGKKLAGTTDRFVERMNQKCQDLGLSHAHMVNPHGLTDYALNDYNQMTSKELFHLVCQLLKDHPEILDRTTKAKIDQVDRHFLAYNTNPLLGIVPGVDGLKTGYTNAAGRCLVATAKIKEIPGITKPARLISLTMGCPSNMARFVLSKDLMEESLSRYSKRIVALEDKPIGEAKVLEGREKKVQVYPTETKTILWDGQKNIKTKVYVEDLKPPVKAGTIVGRAEVYEGKDLVAKFPVKVKENVEPQNVLVRLQVHLYRALEQVAAA